MASVFSYTTRTAVLYICPCRGICHIIIKVTPLYEHSFRLLYLAKKFLPNEPRLRKKFLPNEPQLRKKFLPNEAQLRRFWCYLLSWGKCQKYGCQIYSRFGVQLCITNHHEVLKTASKLAL